VRERARVVANSEWWSMIRLTCPGCGSKLNAKDELIGQTRKCPKCALPVLIAARSPARTEEDLESESTASQFQPPAEQRLPEPTLPERLNRDSHYLICDGSRLVATWGNNDSGWMFNAGPGFVPAKRNRDNLPAEGNFQLVELMFAMTPEGKRLTGLMTYQLVTRWALRALAEGDDAIVRKITGYGCLNEAQKFLVRQALRDQFMRAVWESAANVLEYLGNTDYHSPGPGVGYASA
jgi:hypothetical protein